MLAFVHVSTCLRVLHQQSGPLSWVAQYRHWEQAERIDLKQAYPVQRARGVPNMYLVRLRSCKYKSCDRVLQEALRQRWQYSRGRSTGTKEVIT